MSKAKTKSVVVSCSLVGGRYRGGRHFAHGSQSYDLTADQIEAVKNDPALAIADVAAEAKAAAEQLKHEVEAMTPDALGDLLDELTDAYNLKVDLRARVQIVNAADFAALESLKGNSTADKTPATTAPAANTTPPAPPATTASQSQETATPPAPVAFPADFPHADVFRADGKTYADAKALAVAGTLATVKKLGAVKAAEVAAYLDGK